MNKELFKVTTVLLFCLVGLLSIYGCSSDQEQTKTNEKISPPATLENNQLTIAVNTTIKSASVILAHELGYFENEGIQVDLSIKQSGVATKKALDDGVVDIATVPEIIAADDALVNDSWRILSSINRSVTNELVARRDRGINQVSDLRGKKIGIKKESGSVYWLNQMLIYNSIAMGDIELVDAKPVNLAGMLNRGEVDAVVTWYPHAYQAITDLGENAYHTSAQMGQEVFWLLIAQKSWLAENHELAIRFLKALEKANRYIQNNPTKTKEILAEFLHLDPASIAYEWDRHIFKTELPQNLVMIMEEQMKFRVAQQGEGAAPDPFGLFHFDALKKVNPSSISIAH
nr:ABC transporter substrate-binding protein [Desulfobulbaceae bacterium]